MTDWKLKEVDIVNAINAFYGSEGVPYVSKCMGSDYAVALAAQKRLAKWGNEPCTRHYVTKGRTVVRRNCTECWQALCEELGVK